MKIQTPSEVLGVLHKEVKKMFADKETKDIQRGMNLSILKINEVVIKGKSQIEYAGAKSYLYLYEESMIKELAGDRIAIGGEHRHIEYSNHQVEVEKGSTIYLTSDGFQDQNNQNRKRFGRKRLKSLLSESASQPLVNQRNNLEAKLEEYMENTEQRDDILLIGIKI